MKAHRVCCPVWIWDWRFYLYIGITSLCLHHNLFFAFLQDGNLYNKDKCLSYKIQKVEYQP